MSHNKISPRPQVPKGHRPSNLGNAHLERMLSMIIVIATEVSALRETVDTMARVAAEHGTFSLVDIEAYQPTSEVRAEREQWRKEYIKRLLRVVGESFPEEPGDDIASFSYQSFIEELAQTE